MLREDKYFQTLSEEELWQRYCGFLDFSLEQFMEIQERLLLEEIDLVAGTPLGKKVMRGNKPRTVDEFRQSVPLTSYQDYEPYLSEQRDDMLAEKPLFWCHSSGKSGKFKWVPYTSEAVDKSVHNLLAALILASARRKGHVAIKPGERMLLNLAPRPYTSGCVFYELSRRFSLRVMPPQEEEELMDFQERIVHGFRMALKTGIDEVASIASILVKMGEGMSERAQGIKLSPALLHPAILSRLVVAYIRSRLAHRPMLPKDLWKLKALVAAGTDAKIYKDKMEYFWGLKSYELYGATEAMPLAISSWNKKYMTFVPNIAFWEFLPFPESAESKQDKDYKPATVLMNELKLGESYEVVLTQFYGMPLLRYRMGDIVTVVDFKDEEAGISLPQVAFKTRTSDLINLASLADVDEYTLWKAISNTAVKCEEWSACKEYDHDQTYLRLYMELKEEREPDELAQMIDQQLRAIDIDYRDIGDQLGLQPVKITLLSPGTFQRYYEEKQREGADLAHLKPPHMNVPDTVIERLIQLSRNEEKTQ